MKFQTPVECGKSALGLSVQNKIMVVGSCFADSMGERMARCALDVCVNPFGTLYNPVSVYNSLQRLASGVPFSADECVPMGAGAGLVCSFSHHTSFARETGEEFLKNANAKFVAASDFFKSADAVIITLGTAWFFKHINSGEIVSNCLKREASEFSREKLGVLTTVSLLSSLVNRWKDKKFFFTVSPIRHMADGAHGNQLSKSTLLMAEDAVCSSFPERAEYFPSYEILLDELRDYRFYAEDMTHPSAVAEDYIWQKFSEWAFNDSDREVMSANERSWRRSRHRPNIGK